MLVTDKKIGVLMGGISSEREVSLRSGENVYNVLNKAGYNICKIDVDKNLIENLKKEDVEIAFNVLHGQFGEDGKVQAILEFLDILYTGSDFDASSIAINKVLSKQMVSLHGVKTADFKIINHEKDFDDIDFSFPWVFKPLDGGSSIDVTLIKDRNEIKSLDIKKEKYFVEEFVNGTEVTVGVLDDGDSKNVLPVLELVPQNEFYDFEAKYTKGMTDFIIPANISDEMTKLVQSQSLLVHEILGCGGASRSDFIIKNNIPYFLEINTNPGMTETSDIPAEAKAFGLTDIQLCEKILKSALMRRQK